MMRAGAGVRAAVTVPGLVPLQEVAVPEAEWLMVTNVVIVLLIVATSVGIAAVLVRRSLRQRVEAERLAAVGTAAARIIHQIKNPLQSLMLQAELLADDRVAADERQRGEICAAVLGEAGRLAEHLSELSAYTSGVQRRLEPQPVSLDALVRERAGHELRDAAQEGIEVDVGPLEPVEIEGDPFFIAHALDNILRNAREAVQEGRPGGGRIAVRLGRAGGEATIQVEDNGPGMDADRIGSVFEPFVTTKAKGMGLGLSISRDIVEGHGGRVEIRSRRGIGATVAFHFPLRFAGAREAQPVRPVQHASRV